MRGEVRRGLLGLITVAAIAAAAAANAADSKGVYAVIGAGGIACKDFVAQLQKDKQSVAVADAWIAGYLTAANRVQPDTYSLSPVLGATPVLVRVAGVCEKNPNLVVEKVLGEILKRLAVARNKAQSPIIETKTGKYAASVTTETLIAMQTKLTDYGYFKGKPDGVYGPRLEASLKAFQKDQKLTETGVADAASVIRLLVELPKKKP
jgi:Putative peptidoglycan binding domain